MKENEKPRDWRILERNRIHPGAYKGLHGPCNVYVFAVQREEKIVHRASKRESACESMDSDINLPH